MSKMAADMHLQSAILQSALEELHGDNETLAEDNEDAMDVEADAESEVEADAKDVQGAEEGVEDLDGVEDAEGAEDADGAETAERPTSSATQQMLPPPNGRQFDSRDAAESFVKVFCAQQGYSVSCRRCLRKGVRGFKALFYCSRGRPGDDRRKETTKNTKKTGCPMQFGIDCLQRTDFRWTIDTSITLPHNHGPALPKTPRPVVPFPRRRKVIRPGTQVVAGKLEGRRALITGGDPGIGRSVAVLFAREGADMTIVFLPHEQKDAERTQRLVQSEGRGCLLIPGHLMDDETCKRAVDMHVDRFGMINVLVNNASKQVFCDDITKIDLTAVESTFRSNILQMFAITKYAVPHIERGGSIINTTSTHADRGSSTLVDYSATKGAIVSFTRSLGKQLMAKGIRVNAVALASTPALAQAASRPAVVVDEAGIDTQTEMSVRFKEVAQSFLFLAGLESSSLYGQVINAHPLEE